MPASKPTRERKASADSVSIADTIRSSTPFKKYESILDLILKQFDAHALFEEAKALHAGRKSRNLKVKNIAPMTLAEANLQDVSHRARLVEVRVSITEHASSLATAIKAAKRATLIRYSPDIDVSGVTAKRLYVERFFKEGEAYLAEMNMIMDSLDHFIKDIDQAGYAMKNTVALLNMVYRPENKI